MLFPSVFRDNLFNDFNDIMDWPTVSTDPSLMKSDVKDAGDHYELTMDLPGFSKDNVKLQLKDGVLNFQAATSKSNDEKDKDGKYLRRERFQGTCSRSFYVGKDVKEEDIKAKFENGVLTVCVPKKEDKPEAEENHLIQIEG
ncbi:MAG: Hsp20/alpha crystallin family protein [Eubacterium sp.]|jgi:HSP20 family molecular chaperone IbpA|nr:Hsp20/alpha crystallin family protein [Eubacterium sp.]MCH4047267.1 Hsp20/alpha crystallin family protein [Eubacterium sp.]MCH4080362.1 Hsp20/alpha crystallin family protein [Eubacterium sp.]MCH4110611.1 Hsp20/alpha crystallin family protein [Eubacterium sp.]MCI1307336.1 Hsp20/alpha crystallin family protein [Eubacterium sp.]